MFENTKMYIRINIETKMLIKDALFTGIEEAFAPVKLKFPVLDTNIPLKYISETKNTGGVYDKTQGYQKGNDYKFRTNNYWSGM